MTKHLNAQNDGDLCEVLNRKREELMEQPGGNYAALMEEFATL